MQNIAPEKIEQRLNELPEKVRIILFAPESSENIRQVGQKFGLMIDEVGELADEVGLVIMGFESPKNFARNLVQKMQLAPGVAEQIAVEINVHIFQKIREELQKLNNEPAGAPLPPEPKPYMPPTVAPQPTTDDLRPTTTPTPPGADLGLPKGQSEGIIGTPAGQSGGVITPKIGATPFEHKLKEDDIFRAPAVISEHEAPKPGIMNNELGIKGGAGRTPLPPLPTKAEIKYGGKDPYREPTA